jgi:predicted lipid-binding transport protein (Tim44 family)
VHLDILIFAIIAAFLIYRLNAVLGTRHGAERERRNPYDAREAAPAPVAGPAPALPPKPVAPLAGMDQLVDSDANRDGRIESGLSDISAADPQFEVNSFMGGAKYAFEMIVTAYARGDLATLKPLLSPKLYADFAAGIKTREQEGQTYEVTIHRIKQARILEAHLGGTMAYITVDFDVEETAWLRDRDGKIIDGSPDRIFSVEDIWTFSRDTRNTDPNWILIETRAVEK